MLKTLLAKVLEPHQTASKFMAKLVDPDDPQYKDCS